jgi:hypothetical protein
LKYKFSFLYFKGLALYLNEVGHSLLFLLPSPFLPLY